MEKLSEDKIISIIKEYIENKDNTYAVMIDGEWGSGKTYFIKNKVMKIYEKLHKKGKRFIYVSTYGVVNSSDLDNKVYDAIIKEFLPRKFKNIYKIAEKGFNSIYQIINVFKKLPNIPKNSIRNLIEIIQQQKGKEYILIFDDIERSDMPINELLGYINEFVEHKSMKVIIVANERELSKKKIYSNIELKYLVAEDNNLNIPTKSNRNIFDYYRNPQKQEEKEKTISIEQMDERVEKIFGEDILYKQVKEKLVGMTIYYCPDLKEVLKQLIENQIKNTRVKEYLQDKSKRIIGILENKNHINIRTLKFILYKLEKIFSIVLYIDLSKYENKLFDECKYQLLSYIVYKCIEYKEGNSTATWDGKSEFTYTGTELQNEYIASFKFVDETIVNNCINREKIEEVVTMYVKGKSEKSIDYDDPIKVLEHYWELEDEKIQENIDLIINKLGRDGYDKKLYSKIILLIMRVVDIGFEKELINKIMNIMINNISKQDFKGELDEFDLMFRDDKEVEKFNKTMKPIRDIISQVNNTEDENDINNIINLGDGWGSKFAQYSIDHKNEFQSKKRFFKLIDIQNLIEILVKSKTKDISDFRRTIGSIYNFSNIKDYYIDDVENLNELLVELNKIHEDEVSKYSKSKNYNIKLLKEILKEVIENLNK